MQEKIRLQSEVDLLSKGLDLMFARVNAQNRHYLTGDEFCHLRLPNSDTADSFYRLLVECFPNFNVTLCSFGDDRYSFPIHDRYKTHGTPLTPGLLQLSVANDAMTYVHNTKVRELELVEAMLRVSNHVNSRDTPSPIEAVVPLLDGQEPEFPPPPYPFEELLSSRRRDPATLILRPESEKIKRKGCEIS